jgi:ribonuclease-3
MAPAGTEDETAAEAPERDEDTGAQGGERLGRLQVSLGHRFHDPELLRTALTHRSAANERGDAHYERLEFLGDAVLGLVAAEWLFETLPEEAEGRLARLKSYLVSTRALADWARELEVGGVLVLGSGEERSGGREKQSLLADALEAVLGAVYLDGGLDTVRAVVRPRLEASIEREPQLQRQEAKTMLQEALQARGDPLPEYRLVAELGPPHERTFHVECWVGERRLGAGEGGTKKAAERAAAEEALRVVESQASQALQMASAPDPEVPPEDAAGGAPAE